MFLQYHEPDGLNPGIKRTVCWLWCHNFLTCDSGDGETHEYECDREVAYVVMTVHPGILITEADRLLQLLRSVGVEVEPVSDGDGVVIQATYDPANQTAVLELFGFKDSMLPEAAV